MKNPTPSGARPDPVSLHDAAIREHMVELVRILARGGEYGRLRQVLTDHAAFIQQVLATLGETQGE